MRRNHEEFNDQNYDSFLDIVANLVGILVILIMVIGVRAKNVAKLSPAEVAAAMASGGHRWWSRVANCCSTPPSLVATPSVTMVREGVKVD